ncbi:MAG: hypothetical protein JWO67_4340, partial [Streptosporangiaceae bacterium]|nr:hypothetical protein [Streptosporangiaceae bacterium]
RCDQHLRDEENAGLHATIAWVDALTDDELEQLQQPAYRAGRDLQAELAGVPPAR